MAIRALISDTTLTGIHPENALAALLDGHGLLTAEEVEITTLSGQALFEYAVSLGSVQVIVRSLVGITDFTEIAAQYPEILLFMPLGSNSHVEILDPIDIGSVVACGCGNLMAQGAMPENQYANYHNGTGYGPAIQFWDYDLDTENPVLSSFSTARIAGKVLRIADLANCSIMTALAIARANALLEETTGWNHYDGYGKILDPTNCDLTQTVLFTGEKSNLFGLNVTPEDVGRRIVAYIGGSSLVQWEILGYNGPYSATVDAVIPGVNYYFTKDQVMLLDLATPIETRQTYTANTNTLSRITDVAFMASDVGLLISFANVSNANVIFTCSVLEFISSTSVIVNWSNSADNAPTEDLIVESVNVDRPSHARYLTSGNVVENVDELQFTIEDVGKFFQFWGTNELSYYSLITQFISPSSVVLSPSGRLPITNTTIAASTLVIIDTTVIASGRYCAQSDLEHRIGVENLAQLSNDAENSTLPDPSIIDSVIETATIEIDNILSGTYKTPLTPIPGIIRKLCTDIALYHVMMRRFSIMEMPKQWVSVYTRAIDNLDKLASQENALPAIYEIASPEAGIVANSMKFDFNNPDSQMSKY